MTPLGGTNSKTIMNFSISFNIDQYMSKCNYCISHQTYYDGLTSHLVRATAPLPVHCVMPLPKELSTMHIISVTPTLKIHQ